MMKNLVLQLIKSIFDIESKNINAESAKFLVNKINKWCQMH